MKYLYKAKPLPGSGKRASRYAHHIGKKTIARQLRGILKGEDISLETIREERLAKYLRDT